MERIVSFALEHSAPIGAALSAASVFAVRLMQVRAKERAEERAEERAQQRALETELRNRVTALESEIRMLRQQLAEWQQKYVEALAAAAPRVPAALKNVA